MKRIFFHMKEQKKLEGLPFILISYLVLELRSFEDTKVNAINAYTKQGNRSKSIKIDQIC